MNCDQIKELLEEYVLGSLDADEQALVELHLPECPDCQDLLVELFEAAHLLPEALAEVSPFEPPVELKENLLNRLPDNVAEGSPQRVVTKTNHNSNATPKHVVTENMRQPRQSKAGRPIRSWWRSRPVTLVAALVLLILLAVIGTRLSIVLAEGRALQAELSTLYDQQELVLEVVDSDETVKRFLRTQIPPGDSGLPAYGKLYTRQGLHHVVAMAARLPQPPPGQAYHLWLTDADQTKLVGTLTLNEQGFGLLVFDEDTENPSYDNAQLILQPIESTTPTGKLILLWDATEQ